MARTVTASDLARDHKVVLAELARTGARAIAPLGDKVDGKLRALVNSVAVDVERLNQQARQVDELVLDLGIEVTQAVLDRRELGELALPVGAGNDGGAGIS